MKNQLFSNNTSTNLALPLAIAATSITVLTGKGAAFSSPVGDFFEMLTIEESGDFEIVKMTARVGDVLTIERAHQGTTAQVFTEFASVYSANSAETIQENNNSVVNSREILANSLTREFATILTGQDFEWLDAAWSPKLSLFCMISSTGEIITSPDAKTGNWTLQTTPAGITNLHSLVWVEELSLFFTTSGSKIITSPDGENWSIASTQTGFSFRGVTYIENVGAVAYGFDGYSPTSAAYAYSADAATWTPKKLIDGSGIINGIASNDNQTVFAVLTVEGAIYIGDSIDTIATEVTPNVAQADWYAFEFIKNNRFVAIERNGDTRTSSDGENWTLNAGVTGGIGYVGSVIYSKELGVLLIAGHGGSVFSTTFDGKKWLKKEGVPIFKWVGGICFSSEHAMFLCAVREDTDSTIITSK